METDELLYQREMASQTCGSQEETYGSQEEAPKEEKRRAVRNELVQINTLSQFSHSVVSDSLRPHELQHARPPCPSPTPGVHSDSCPSSR